jgi:poly-gamma-glutamate capsule biosynthesis protein CapA/YwtB (metallophosphatase superfamily)
MRRYFFHLEGGPKGEFVSDNRGQVLPDDGAARREAEAIAAALKKRHGNAWRVIVADQWGHDFAATPARPRAEDSANQGTESQQRR